eukprot:jgi/Hompol1/841/HPOL_005439-RA
MGTVAAVVARLRDVSGDVVKEAIAVLSHLSQVIGSDALMGFVSKLPRLQRHVFRIYKDRVLSSALASHQDQDQDPNQDQDWKLRASAIETLYKSIHNPTLNAADLIPHLNDLIVFLAPLINDANLKIVLTTLHIIANIITIVQQSIAQVATPLFKLLASRYASPKTLIRHTSIKLVIKLLQTVPQDDQQTVIDLLWQTMRDSNPRIREEALNTLIIVLIGVPSASIALSLFVQNMLELIRDSKPKVRRNTSISSITFIETTNKKLRSSRNRSTYSSRINSWTAIYYTIATNININININHGYDE